MRNLMSALRDIYNFIRKSIYGYLEVEYPAIFRLLHRHKTGVKYIFAGGTAALVNLFFLFVLTDIFGLWYLISSLVAFIISLLTSFFLQKFWTFRDRGWQRIKKQSAIYIALGGADFILTPVLLYTLVEKFNLWYLPAAVIVMGGLAMGNYLINKFITFKKREHESINV